METQEPTERQSNDAGETIHGLNKEFSKEIEFIKKEPSKALRESINEIKCS
jgi:hypothetical protein